MNVFDLQAKIALDTSGFAKNLNAAAGQMESFGAKIEGIIGNIAQGFATIFAVDQVTGFFETAVSEFGRFEQLVGGVDTLFKGSSQTLQTYADNAFRTAGMSANEYMDTATGFAASLIQALDGDTEAAVDMVDMAVTDMADNANKMGTDIGSIQHAYQGFAKQNYTMLDNLKLGYGGTKSEMARLINDTGILGDTIVEVSTMTKQGNFDSVVSFDTVVQAIHAVQENMEITGTTAEEAAGTIEGSVASMKAAWSNWLGGLGDENADLSGLTDNLIGSVETAVVDNILPTIGRIGESLTQVFTDLTGIDLSPVTEVFDGLKTTLSDIGTAFAEGGAAGALDTITQKLSELTGLDLSGISGALSGIVEAVSGIGTAFAEGGISGGIDEIVRVFTDLTGIDLSGVSDAMSGLSEAFSGIAGAFAKGGISGGITDLAASFTELTGIDITGIVDNFLAMSTAFSGIGEAFAEGGIAGTLKMLAGTFADLTGIDLTGLASGIGTFLNEFVRVDGGTLSRIGTAIQNVLGAFSGVNLAGIISAIADALGVFLSVIDDIAEGTISFVAEIISQLARDFNDTLAPGLAAAAAGIGTFMGYLGLVHIFQNAGTAIAALKTAFSGLFTVLSANPIGLIVSLIASLAAALLTAYNTNEDFRNSIQNLWQDITTTAASAVEALQGIVADITTALSEAVTAVREKIKDFIQAGAGLAEGLVNGIKEKLNSAKETITNTFGKVTDWVKGVFDEHSPSRVFAEIGRNLMRGLAIGVDDEAGIVQDTINKMRLTVPAITTGSVDFASSGIGRASAATINSMLSSASQGGGVYNINLTVDGRTLANVVFDPLNGIIKQKGATLGA